MEGIKNYLLYGLILIIMIQTTYIVNETQKDNQYIKAQFQTLTKEITNLDTALENIQKEEVGCFIKVKEYLTEIKMTLGSFQILFDLKNSKWKNYEQGVLAYQEANDYFQELAAQWDVLMTSEKEAVEEEIKMIMGQVRGMNKRLLSVKEEKATSYYLFENYFVAITGG